MSLIKSLAEIPLLLGEVEILEEEVAGDGQPVTTPGVATSINGIMGSLALIFTPTSDATTGSASTAT